MPDVAVEDLSALSYIIHPVLISISFSIFTINKKETEA